MGKAGAVSSALILGFAAAAAVLAPGGAASGAEVPAKPGATAVQRQLAQRPNNAPRSARAIAVTTAKVQMRVVGNRVAAVGTGRAFRSLTLLANVSGTVEKINFTPGQSVREGQELVVLESEAQRIAVRLAQVKVADAQAKLRRYETLAKRDTVSGVQLEEARTALATAKAELEAKQYELKRRTIVAPFAGVMGLTKLGKGDYLREASEIGTIDDTSKLIVEFVVAESYASAIKLGQDVRALTPAILGIVFQGKVSAKDSRIDVASRTLKVEATLPNPDNRLIPGLTFSVSIRIEGDTLPMVPGLAVQWDRNGAHVWVVRADSTVARVGVRIRSRTNSSAWIEGKLKEGDTVVVEGVQQLRPGIKVRVVKGS